MENNENETRSERPVPPPLPMENGSAVLADVNRNLRDIKSQIQKEPVVQRLSKLAPLPGSDETFQMYGDVFALFDAILKAKPQFMAIIKALTGQKGHQTFKYADLQELLDKTEPMLTKEGVLTMQFLTGDPGSEKMRVRTMISGHGGMIMCDVAFDPRWAAKSGDAGIKDVGLLTTYLARYQYRGAYGLVGQDADDVPENIPVGKLKNKEEYIPPAESRPRPSAKRPNGNKPVEKPDVVAENLDRKAEEKEAERSGMISVSQNNELKGLTTQLLDTGALQTMDQVLNVIKQVTNTTPAQVKAGNITYGQAEDLIAEFKRYLSEAKERYAQGGQK